MTLAIALARFREFREKTLKFSARIAGTMEGELGRIGAVERARWEVHDLPEHGPSTTDASHPPLNAPGSVSCAQTSAELTVGASVLSAEIERLLKAAKAALHDTDVEQKSVAPLPSKPSLIDEPTRLVSPIGIAMPAASEPVESDVFHWPQWRKDETLYSIHNGETEPVEETAAEAEAAIPVRLVLGRLASTASVAQIATSEHCLSFAAPPSRPVEIRWQGRVRARGTLVAVEGRFGVRVTELVPANDTIHS
jgi:flagellar motor switch/type III secretory pathway protein FliN